MAWSINFLVTKGFTGDHRPIIGNLVGYHTLDGGHIPAFWGINGWLFIQGETKSKVRRKGQGSLWERNGVAGDEFWSNVEMNAVWSVPWHSALQGTGNTTEKMRGKIIEWIFYIYIYSY